MNEDSEKLFKLLTEQNEYLLELTDRLIEIFAKSEMNFKEGRELVDGCGGLTLEFHFRKKIADLKKKEHDFEIKRIEQKTEKLIKLNNERELMNNILKSDNSNGITARELSKLSFQNHSGQCREY